MKWYIIHAYSGFERKVRESLESRVQAFGLQNKIGKVLIRPNRSPKFAAARIYFGTHVLSGYVLVEMDMDDHVCTWSSRRRG